jgi:hypothetical protein
MIYIPRYSQPTIGGESAVMGLTTMVDGFEVDTSGELRTLELHGRLYVVGRELLIAVQSRREARDEIRKIKELEY